MSESDEVELCASIKHRRLEAFIPIISVYLIDGTAKKVTCIADVHSHNECFIWKETYLLQIY